MIKTVLATLTEPGMREIRNRDINQGSVTLV